MEERYAKIVPCGSPSSLSTLLGNRMWWTLTGNFGNILPIDWTKSFSRKMHIPTLNLADNKKGSPEEEVGSSEDEAVAGDLDMHALILGGLHHDHECPVKTADEVIQEIDDMMQETPSSEGDLLEYNEALEKGKEMLSSPLYEDSVHVVNYDLDPVLLSILITVSLSLSTGLNLEPDSYPAHDPDPRPALDSDYGLTLTFERS
ncbi:Fasciculation and elongation protein zeta-2 [Eumeta japonica]|uniref:Fasciculation and elongation protein zeta-2 n=1 Tax=Eumeta variegata TaxID=151549 RepID=A0A4C1U823_EUMVA|nr:Fasciculation and elongation protein zeta-2 [Eumeta japonica]